MTLGDTAQRAFAPAAALVERQAIPGAALGLVTRQGDRAVALAGWASTVPERHPLTRQHWFDLASLTKVLVTTPMILQLAAEGRIELDRPLTDAIPDLRQYDMGAPERRLTFRDCLAHRTHLPAVEPIYTYGSDPETLRAFVLQRAWTAGPSVYSDVNFIYLGVAIERFIDTSLHGLPVAPGLAWGPPPGPAVATERCTWRGRVMQGEVHDENAFALGGAAGHAGLFGTIDGVLGAAEAILCEAGPGHPVRERVHDNRTCGWERRFPRWHGGEACSDATIGHTGFTGTGLWIDFDRGLAWTLLTNRIHPTRHSDAAMTIYALRPAIGDAVIAAFDGP